MNDLRLRLYGRLPGADPQAGVPLRISWEAAFDNLSKLPRMFAEPDGSFLWSGDEESLGHWQLEGTLFDDGQVVRRIELVGNCDRVHWQTFLKALNCDCEAVSVESLNDSCVFDGHWLLSQSSRPEPADRRSSGGGTVLYGTERNPVSPGQLMNYESPEPPLDAVRQNNQQAWDRMARSGHKLTNPATRQEMDNALRVIDASGWLPGGIRGWKVLCLAAGGGRHGPLYAAAGAQVTVVDLSPAMLERDREVAAEFGVQVHTIQTSMDQLDMLPSGSFDLVVQPVSSCYLASVSRMFPEIARVTRPQGLYISQHKQPANLQTSLDTYTGHYVVEHAYYDKRSVPPATSPTHLREPGTQEFIHSWSDLLGGICRSGFAIEDVTEPDYGKADSVPGSFGHRCYFVAPYVRIKARRLGETRASQLITF